MYTPFYHAEDKIIDITYSIQTASRYICRPENGNGKTASPSFKQQLLGSPFGFRIAGLEGTQMPDIFIFVTYPGQRQFLGIKHGNRRHKVYGFQPAVRSKPDDFFSTENIRGSQLGIRIDPVNPSGHVVNDRCFAGDTGKLLFAYSQPFLIQIPQYRNNAASIVLRPNPVALHDGRDPFHRFLRRQSPDKAVDIASGFSKQLIKDV
ncbi:hypothetical protein D3C75_866510 [compost metagenome]